ncbi:MAG: hypothetical protein HUU46_18190 [Candidatus Hydrogenedentes bacterium]|nr:hypothetical protein [Candidatus Hydrogenedentota bacterium]
MQSEDRPIHFSSELIHAPHKHALPPLQKLYYELSQTKHANYLSSDFSPTGPPRFFTKRGRKTQSTAVFLPDRVLVAEEWVDVPFAQFLERLDAVAELASRELGIPSFVAHAVTIRTTFALTHFSDARVFVFEQMCGLEGKIGPHLGRPIAVGGLRFVMPETPDHPGTLHTTIESYRYSQNEIFVEVKGVFAREPIAAGELRPLRENCRLVRDFISGHIYPYLDQFDVPVEDAR